MAERKIEVTTKTDQSFTDLAAMTVTIWLTYYILDPEAFERHKAIVRGAWQKLQHQISVWQARRDIQSLPETDAP